MADLTAAEVTKGKLKILSDDYDGIGIQEFVFHFNPTTVKDSHPPTWTASKIPGQSHPVYQYGGSGERTISFQLYLDGDRGRLHRVSATSGRRVDKNTGFDPINKILKRAAALAKSQATARLGIRKPVGYIKSTARVVGNAIVEVDQPIPAINPRATYSIAYKPSDVVGMNIDEDINFFRRFSYPGNQGGKDVSAPCRVLFNLGEAYKGIECICEVGDITITYFTAHMEPVRATIDVKLKQVVRQPMFRSSVVNRLG